MPQQYPLFGLGVRSKSPNLTASSRINLYYDIQPADNEKYKVTAIATPGTQLFSTVSSQVTRGIHWMESNNVLYVVQRGDIWAAAPDGTATVKKSLTTFNPTDITGRVSMDNNGTELCIVTGAHGYIYNTVTDTLTDITSDLPAGGSDTVAFLDGRFIVNRSNTGQFYASDAYDGLTWDALNFATAESTPDNLVSVVADKGYLVLFGTSSTEIWVNAGLQGFPFMRVNGAPSMAGLASRWSLSRCAGNLTGLFRNRQGALTIAQLEGYSVNPISNSDIDYLINRYQSPTDCVGFGYSMDGRAFYQITFTDEGVTWLYEHSAKQWTQLKGYGLTRHIADLCAAFGQQVIVTDYQNGNLYQLSSDYLTDNGAIIEREIVGAHISANSQNNITISRLRVKVEGGVGTVTSQGSDPTIMLQISRDNGHTWGRELWTSIGKLGEYRNRAEWRRLGLARDWVFKLRITDPVKPVIISAVFEGEEANK